MTTENFELSVEVKQKIDHWLSKYPVDQRRSAVVAALLLAQKQNGGFLSEIAMKAVADYLRISSVEVYEVATFYDMFHLKPIGKHKISVCTNVSCMLRGSDQVLEYVKKRLDIEVGETTQDEQITLCEAECMAACGGAPMCQIDDQQYHENLTPEKMEKILDQLCS